MYRLSFIIILVLFIKPSFSQNPHGEAFEVDCRTCHNPESWLISIDTFLFNHDTTNFALSGQHEFVDCKTCHTSLIFNDAQNQCIDCHLDIHSQTVGNDCVRCHNSESWLVDNIFELHEENGFPLLGAHDNISCIDCHKSDTHLRFDRMGNECNNCHLTDFQTADSPNHIERGFSTNCIECHNVNAEDWSTEFIRHDFFPLTEGHDIEDCKACHLTDDFADVSPDCVSCHLDDFNNAFSPNHTTLNFDTDCIKCHTTSPDWMPANFVDHDDLYFPIYSGEHEGEWSECIDCHTNPNDYSTFSCIACHTSPETEDEHDEVEGFVFEDNACLACHPNGDSDSAFDHNTTDFPLTGAHIGVDCLECHSDGFAGTSTNCVDCHEIDFETALMPNHEALNFSNDCVACHTTDPGWMPANFMDHDNLYFPIYSGAHQGEWSECLECHTNPNDYSIFSCIACHTSPETEDEHEGVIGFVFEDKACLACHPTGDTETTFDHNATNFPLTGAHIGVDCLECHSDGFVGTTTQCVDCHTADFSNTINPNHQSLNVSNDCINCHTTEPDWMPASFDIHDDFWVIQGAHLGIANDCNACHNGDYNNTPNTCVGCHLEDFNATQNPNHTEAQFNTDCVQCHNEEAWQPTSFDHDGQYFPIYSGAHDGEWSNCVECHLNPNDFTQFTCIGCHINPETDEEHEGVSGYVYEDNACLACHPSGDADMVFDHNTTAFPLTGEHINVDCNSCHLNGFVGTPTECAACHELDYINSVNPNHQNINISQDCMACHTTDADWMPAQFEVHNEYYALNGAHAVIANNCVECHNGDYNNTPNTCVGCHLNDYNNTINPDHIQAQFSTDCTSCHTEDSWIPATFDHDMQYFPIYSGSHAGEWNQCIECHINPANYSEYTCVACHLNPETDEDHEGITGYVYLDNACLGCHPNGESEGAFDHNATNFPLTGAHVGLDCFECHMNGYIGTPLECVACHTEDFNGSTNPNHLGIGIDTDCMRCHSTEPGWAPAGFDIHDQYYQLTGEHTTIINECILCHNGDYNNTPNTCVGCHNEDYLNSVNPNHSQISIPTDCVACHTTDPNWMPATFDIHDDYYPLIGAHATIMTECVLCHNGDYTNTPNTCVGCHLNEYNNTTNPDHALAQFSTDCISCHNEDAWEPATFDHDAQYFPIYSGSHQGEWSLCLDCHINPNDYAEFTCIACHVNPETDDDHMGVGGYIYEDNACFFCHPTGESDMAFNHDDTSFPLEAGHGGLECLDCHINGFVGTPTNCDACHMPDYNGTSNPDHGSLSFPVDCAQCHTTDPGWMPATFDIHDDYYVLTGAHSDVATDCAVCHNGDYINTPNTCDGCHMADYNLTSNPNHSNLSIPTACDMCHTTDPGWTPATFDIHDDYYELTGVHLDIADDCIMCHNGDYNNTPNTCNGCHSDDYNVTSNPDHSDLNLPISCDDCHTTDPDWMPATFDIHDDYYQLNGAHAAIANDCVACHNGDYSSTPNTCVGCHLEDYNSADEPDHIDNNLSTDCLDCHNENAWVPADFDHNDFWVLEGAHQNIANDCFACHMGDYSNTPNDCIGCHQSDYDNTTNPDHSSAMFPTDCLACHSQTAWEPSTFDHDGMYFPIYSGKHEGEWNLCVDCHVVTSDYTIFSCIDCHEHDNEAEVDDDHDGVGGYVYESNACFTCHPTGED